MLAPPALLPLLLVFMSLISSARCFLVQPLIKRSSFQLTHRTKFSASKLPDIERILKAPFMEQVKIGGLVTQALELPPNEADSTLPQVLSAQLSTSDGIRGFFVSYLTLDASPTPPPPLLASTISNLSGSTEHIIDLSLMNVIMPASQSFHFKREAANEKEAATEEEVAMEGSNESMARTSALTCARGKEIMKVSDSNSNAQPHSLLRSSSSPPPSS